LKAPAKVPAIGPQRSRAPAASRCPSRRSDTTSFHGFSNALYEFLRDLAGHNNKQWFTANKERYVRYAKEPAIQFIISMKDRLAGISQSYIADPRVNGGSLFRIYRDTRFSRDKQPFKENIGFQFRHIAGKDAHAPGYYVHIQPGDNLAGGGIWMPPTAILNRIRDAMIRKTDEWLRVKNFIASSGNVAFMEGSRLKRPPQGYPPDHPLVEDLKVKTIFAGRSFSDREVVSPAFIDEVEGVFSDLRLKAFVHIAI